MLCEAQQYFELNANFSITCSQDNANILFGVPLLFSLLAC